MAETMQPGPMALTRKALWQVARGRHLRPHLATLEAFAAAPPAAQRAMLATQLQQQVRYFAARADALPEWVELARCARPEEVLAGWASLPILTKDDLNHRFNPDRLVRDYQLVGVASSTGGSTGEPTRFFLDQTVVEAREASTVFCHRLFGWEPGLQVICVWGSDRDIGRQKHWSARVKGRLRGRVMVDGYRLTSATTDAVIDALRQSPTSAIYGFTSMLEYIARDVLQRGIEVRPGRVRCAWNGGEMLCAEQSARFEQAFGVPIQNLYGGREMGPMAYQPRGAAALRLIQPFKFVEIVGDDGRPVSPGEVGRLIWTDTVCRGTPFLRYDIGDLGAAPTTAAADAPIGELASLHGRRSGILTLDNGDVIQGIFWNHLFKEFGEVEQFQIAFRPGAPLVIRLVGRGFSAERDADLRARLTAFLRGMAYEITWVDAIAPGAQGKREQVVREPAP
ncbi:MAG TPA: hypothetical protein DCZ72_15735 [Armatimonadetes bacterium]|nr:hypothetical protein [Armatimonadota bacterium]